MADADAMEFWFQLDDRFLFNRTREVDEALRIIRGPDFILSRWTEHRAFGSYPEGFVEDVTPLRRGIEFLATEQLALMDRQLGGDPDALRGAFEAFGQGTLFDDRRSPGNKVHMMDTSGPANPPIGYHRWHPIVRATIFLGIDADRWTEIDRYVGLAWAIQSEARPVQDALNRALPAERLEALRGRWLGLSLDELDAAFDSFPYPAGTPTG